MMFFIIKILFLERFGSFCKRKNSKSGFQGSGLMENSVTHIISEYTRAKIVILSWQFL